MTLPNFVIAGAMKAATTSLFNYLGQHPQVYTSPIKETRFFNFDSNNPQHVSKGYRQFPVRTLEEYEAQFDAVTDELAYGEASPNYLIGPRAPIRMKEVIPDVRLIFSLRHPVDRLYSLYQMQLIGGRPSKDLDTIFRPGSEWTEKGRYSPHFERWLSYFDRSQLKMVLAEDLETDPATVLRSLFQYLEIDDQFTPDFSKRHHQGGVPKNKLAGGIERGLRFTMFYVQARLPKLKPYIPQSVKSMRGKLHGATFTRPQPLPPALTQELEAYYAEDVRRLEELLGIDLSVWGITGSSARQNSW